MAYFPNGHLDCYPSINFYLLPFSHLFVTLSCIKIKHFILWQTVLTVLNDALLVTFMYSVYICVLTHFDCFWGLNFFLILRRKKVGISYGISIWKLHLEFFPSCQNLHPISCWSLNIYWKVKMGLEKQKSVLPMLNPHNFLEVWNFHLTFHSSSLSTTY